MKQHVNFYENLKEAHIRLRNTVVLYDKRPFTIQAITEHKDGIFRVYMTKLFEDKTDSWKELWGTINNYPGDHPLLAQALDKVVEMENSCLIRKQMNSPHFNRFRPFPLGMCNWGKKVHYLERQPLRQTHQGLTQGMLIDVQITTSVEDREKGRFSGVGLYSKSVEDTILGHYPTAAECLSALTSGKVENEAAAFHRQFALARGPIDMLFLAYKADIVGVLPQGDFSSLKLGRQFQHVREVVRELGLFQTIA